MKDRADIELSKENNIIEKATLLKGLNVMIHRGDANYPNDHNLEKEPTKTFIS